MDAKEQLIFSLKGWGVADKTITSFLDKKKYTQYIQDIKEYEKNKSNEGETQIAIKEGFMAQYDVFHQLLEAFESEKLSLIDDNLCYRLSHVVRYLDSEVDTLTFSYPKYKEISSITQKTHGNFQADVLESIANKLLQQPKGFHMGELLFGDAQQIMSYIGFFISLSVKVG